jgi:hypothetical protein
MLLREKKEIVCQDKYAHTCFDMKIAFNFSIQIRK